MDSPGCESLNLRSAYEAFASTGDVATLSSQVVRILESAPPGAVEYLGSPYEYEALCALTKALDAPPLAMRRLVARHICTRYALGDREETTFDSLVRAGADVLTQWLLTQTINVDVALEEWLRSARRAALCASVSSGGELARIRPLVIALAHQAFNNEYVIVASAEEVGALRQMSAMRTSLPGDVMPEWMWLLRSMYEPPIDAVDALERSRRPLDSYSPDVRDLVTRTLHAPLTERRIQPALRTFGTLDRVGTATMGRQYEHHPYPRWTNLGGHYPPLTARLATLPNYRSGTATANSRPRLLVAGCGTGRHPLRLAIDNPGAEIVAVDISRASLAYGERESAERKIRNVTFLQGDLLDIAELGLAFDHIECVGVLHHLTHQREGWRALAAVLKPLGTMHVGVYSRVARMALHHVRTAMAQKVVSEGQSDPRAWRARVLHEHWGGPLARSLTRYVDFFSTSGVCDLVFNPHEHHYDLQELETITSSCGLTLLAAVVPDVIRRRVTSRQMVRWPIGGFEQWRGIEWAYAGTARMFECWLQKVESDGQ